MEIIRLHHDDHPDLHGTCVALGFFDGVHRAHSILLNQCLRLSEAHGWDAAVMTFSTHVLAYIQGKAFHHLTSLRDKERIFSEMGFERMYVLNVDDAMVGLKPDVFVSRFLSGAEHVVAGYDFSYGDKGKGKTHDLKGWDFGLTVIQKITDKTKKIGSQRIRKALENGDVSEAGQLLGRPYALHGQVIPGRRRGRHLGYPTANIDYDGYLLPKRGVYHTQTKLNDTWHESMTNIGHNPTFNDGGLMVETHIFGFQGDLYDESITIRFIRYLRPEKKFRDKESLIEQMERDKQNVLGDPSPLHNETEEPS